MNIKKVNTDEDIYCYECYSSKNGYIVNFNQQGDYENENFMVCESCLKKALKKIETKKSKDVEKVKYDSSNLHPYRRR